MNRQEATVADHRPGDVVRGVDAHWVAPAGGRDGRPAPGPSGRRADRRARLARRRVPGGDEAFTLVELLVVVAVLVTLVGIAIPTFARQQDSAWDAAVRAQLRAGTIALASHHAQNATYLPAAVDPSQGWGYEHSSEVVAYWSDFTDVSYCGRAWRRGADDPAIDDLDALAAVAATRATFFATPDGVEPVAEGRTCP
jgi:prepilin-type N-terminal cleavage/methylation domain-containing protein